VDDAAEASGAERAADGRDHPPGGAGAWPAP
jgi:hypothetical protein